MGWKCSTVGVFAPAGPNTIWKRESCGEREADVYESLMSDSVAAVIPRMYRKVEYRGSSILRVQLCLCRMETVLSMRCVGQF